MGLSDSFFLSLLSPAEVMAFSLQMSSRWGSSGVSHHSSDCFPSRPYMRSWA